MNLWPSFFAGGFECSTHVRLDGRRLDLLAATGHDRLALADYRRLQDHGLSAARDGIRWHLIESRPGHYDWSSLVPMLRAAREAQIHVTWDLCHYGWPHHLDIWSEKFPLAFARFCAEAARVVRDESPQAGASFCPVNEISYWAWAGAEVGRINPCATARGRDLKRILVRSALLGTAAIREVSPDAAIICAEPMIHVMPNSAEPCEIEQARAHHDSQFEAVDMLLGRVSPELGGHPSAVDVIGVNYYPDNQWYFGGSTIPLGHHAYAPMSDLLAQWSTRYGTPLIISETGSEGSARAAWLHYVAAEVSEAMAAGADLQGICLYPVIDYPGWDNERMCSAGLFAATPERSLHRPLARELSEQRARLPLAARAAASKDPISG